MRGWKPTQCRIPLWPNAHVQTIRWILPQHAIIMALTSIAAVTVSTDALPLKISPRDGNTSLQFLKEWMAANKDWLDQKLLEHGAILLQGFDVNEAIDFQEAVLQFSPDLCDTYRGTSPRNQIPGTQYVFSASEFPPHYPIPQHLEMAFLPAPPRRLFFCCLEAPTSAGGETCLADYKKVYETMDPKIRQSFEDKGVMHIRNYVRQRSYFTDPSMMKGWEAVFGTKDQEEVARELTEDRMEHSWGENDSLRIVNRVPAIEKHPQSGHKVWFNHLMVFHWTMYYDEPYRVYQRLGGLKQLLYSWVLWAASFFYIGLKAPSAKLSLGMNTCYGDGAAIPYRTVSHVRDTVWRNLVFNRWEQGDVLMIDNFRVSHGRQPFSGRRKIVVSWSNPMTRLSLIRS
ncbi:dapdiamide synthesis protein DdaC-like isoform X1 [Halichondria panicea]|uniref:dapdiamide synthesis protein DdaC-like isoform X1 n=1 Tax=Halichondria panicea TaxID=6063 RepID=UPI00312B9845